MNFEPLTICFRQSLLVQRETPSRGDVPFYERRRVWEIPTYPALYRGSIGGVLNAECSDGCRIFGCHRH